MSAKVQAPADSQGGAAAPSSSNPASGRHSKGGRHASSGKPASGGAATSGTSAASQSVLGRIALPLVLAAIAIAIMLYPVVVTQLKNLEQIRVSQNYTAQVEQAPQEELEKSIQAAHDYNAAHGTGPILDPWLARVSADNADYQEYLAQLSLFDVMGRLVIPAINVDLPIYHGTGEDALQRGVGHLYGSDLPVGGPGTHAVLSAHSGLRNATLFDNLHKVEVGDVLYIEVAGERLKYQVTETEVVLPNVTDSLGAVSGRDRVTLITCTPYGINSHRLLVHADRVPMDPEEAAAPAPELSLNWQWWMFALIAGASVLAVGIALWARKQVRLARSSSPETYSETA